MKPMQVQDVARAMRIDAEQKLAARPAATSAAASTEPQVTVLDNKAIWALSGEKQ